MIAPEARVASGRPANQASRVPTRRRRVPRRPLPTPEDELPDEPEPTVRPSERPWFEEDDGGRLVPVTNVGGAAPTVLGGDSGGDLPGAGDELTNLIEPEPPESPEVGAVHVRRDERAGRRRRP